jgi:hypothetical protein
MWKRLLWPDVESEADADAVTRRGFWLCIALSVLTLLPGLVGADKAGVLTGSAFMLTAAVGVRNRSLAAAAAVLLVYAGERLLLLRLGENPAGMTPGIITALLVANLRATWLASRWPVLLQEARTLPDKFADAFPFQVWRYAQWLFWPLAAWMAFGLVSMSVAA